MKRIRRGLVTMGIVFGLCVLPVSRAHATYPVIDYAAIAKFVLMIDQYRQQIQQFAEMIGQYEQMIEMAEDNLESLDFSIIDGYGGAFEQMIEALGGLNGALDALQGAYGGIQIDSDIDTIWTFLQEINDIRGSSQGVLDAAVSNGATVLASLPGSAAQLRGLVGASQGAVGALQAAQAGNQIAATTAGEVMKLNSQIAALIQAQAAKAKEEQLSESAKEIYVLNKLRDFYDEEVPVPLLNSDLR